MIRKIYYFVTFVLYYIGDIWVSNFFIAVDILSPKHRMTPAIVDIKLDTKNENQILALSNLISMTPGTLVVGYSEKSNTIKVHAMYYDDPAEFETKMETIKRRIARLF